MVLTTLEASFMVVSFGMEISLPKSDKSVSTTTKGVLEQCPMQKQSVLWYNNYMLHYSNQSFFSIIAVSLTKILFNLDGFSNLNQFK